MDMSQIEEIYNQTFPGLAFFYRDTILSEDLIAKYKVGQILTERGFTDMTFKSGGLATNGRYLIASAHGKNVSAFDPEAEKGGHILLVSDSWFKVLDIYNIGDKTQICLLEIPENAVDFFAENTSDVETEIAKKAKENFDANIHTTPVPELQTLEWRERTQFPIGMNDTGEFFYIRIGGE